MKTLDEVVEKCQENVDDVNRGWDEEDCYLPHSYMVDVLHYLKQYQEIINILHKHGFGSIWGIKLPNTQKIENKPNIDESLNMPLTWDELKQKIGEPVWLETDFADYNKYGRWAIIEGFDTTKYNFEYIVFKGDSILSKEYINIDWKAYKNNKIINNKTFKN